MKRLVSILRDMALFAIIYIVALLVVRAFITPDDDLNFMLFSMLSSLVVFLLLGVYERVVYKQLRPIARRASGFDPRAVLWGVVLLVAISVVISPLEALLPADNQSLPDGGWTVLAAVILAPIMEELIFRGRLISLLGHSCRPGAAVVLSALLFAVAHGSFVVGINAFVSGVIFGYFYLLKRSIITPILLHICNNAVAYSLIILSYQDKSIQELVGSSNAYFLIYAAAWVVVAIGMMHLFRTLYRADRSLPENVENVDAEITSEE